ncbi:MAG: sulfite exporter TauE/SafE family protein [Verrucomicrobiales bacterium]
MPFLPEDVTASAYMLALLGALCLGFSKAGFPGLAIVNVVIIAEVFGAKDSVGIVLPLLICCDLIVYPLFRRFASWRAILPLLPPALIGILVGWRLLGAIDNETARRVIGWIILAMVALQVVRAYFQNFLRSLPDSLGFLWGSGLAIGVSTTLANAAGPVYSVYALVRRLKKEDFLGIGARFFLLVNLIKVPFLGELDIINPRSLHLDACLLPGIVLGIWLGKRTIARVPQHVFEWLLYGFTVAAGVRMVAF